MKFMLQPIILEALALRRVMEFCLELSFTRVVFERDAQAVIEANNNGEENWTWHGKLIDDNRRLPIGRPQLRVQFTYKEANEVAH